MLKQIGLMFGALLLVGCGGGSGGSKLPAVPSSQALSSSAGSSLLPASSSLMPLSSSSSSVSLSSSSSFPTSSTAFALGADLGWVTEMEDNNKKFYNAQSEQKDAFELTQSLGIDAIRLRVWVNPGNKYNTIQDVVAKALRAKALGQRVMINFHYSDIWADPGKQFKPEAWSKYSFEELKTALATHTRNSLIALRDAGVEPEWVQVGNETNDGFLWDTARPSVEPKNANMKNYAELTTAGYDAVKEIFPNAKVIVHLSNCHDNANFRWIFDGLTANNAKFDVIGASSYPTRSATETNSTWQTITQNCLANLNDMVSRYQRPVILAEIGVPWDHPEGKAIVADLISKARAVDGGKGLGVFYWEPLAYDWNGYSLGAFDLTGKPTTIMDAFSEAAASLPK